MIAALGLACWVPVAALGPVELRGGLVEDAPVESVSVAGVRVGGERPRLIAWDHVRRFTGDDAGHNTEENLGRAGRAWRARLRLARGDIQLAGPLFEALHEEFRGVEGPTALMVAEGLTRCRFWAGDVAGAIGPWLRAVELRERGAEIAGDPPLNPTLDPETMLIPALPPLLPPGERPGDAPAVVGEAAGAPIASAMRRAAWRVAGAGWPDEAPAPEAAGHPGVRLLRTMADALGPDADARAGARSGLEAGLSDEDAPAWREAWLRAALGLSLLREPGEDAHADAVEHLLHLPARFGRAQPYLAGLALAVVADHLRGAGRDAEAEILERELETRYPRHPAERWLAERNEARRRAPAGPESP
jgi:hypothetical protein